LTTILATFETLCYLLRTINQGLAESTPEHAAICALTMPLAIDYGPSTILLFASKQWTMVYGPSTQSTIPYNEVIPPQIGMRYLHGQSLHNNDLDHWLQQAILLCKSNYNGLLDQMCPA
jgi:hypothetical protein